jgi:hypothetical protein
MSEFFGLIHQSQIQGANPGLTPSQVLAPEFMAKSRRIGIAINNVFPVGNRFSPFSKSIG